MKINKTEVFYILILIIIAFVLRAYDILNFPWGLHVDEVENALLSSNANWNEPVVYFYGWKAGGKESLFIYLLKFSREFLFGNSIFALRIVPIVIGTSTVILYYLFNRNLFQKRKIAFILTLPFAFSVTHITFSKLALRTILVPFFLLLIANFLLNYIKSKKPINIYLYAFFLGLGIYSYSSFIAIIPIGIFILLMLIYKKLINLKLFFVLCLTVLLTISPMLYFLKDGQNRQEYFKRSQGISITNPIWHHNSQKWFVKTLLIDNPIVVINKLTINSYTDERNNYRYQVPYIGMIDPFILVLFIFGLFAFFKFNKDKKDKLEKFIFGLCILGASALGAIITVELRGYTIRLLPTYTFILIFLSYLIYLIFKNKPSIKIKKLIYLLIALSVISNFYFTFVSLKTQWATYERFDEDYYNVGLIIKEKLGQNPNTIVYMPDGDERYKNIFYTNFGRKTILKINQVKVFDKTPKTEVNKIMVIRESDFNEKVNKYSLYKDRITNITTIPKLRAYGFIIVEFK